MFSITEKQSVCDLACDLNHGGNQSTTLNWHHSSVKEMVRALVATEHENAIGNLLAAYEGEINSHARYKAYAVEAEAEGRYGAASLFRAAARAEQIHANNHARVIRHMGGEARAEIRPFRVMSTLENLRAALGGEQYEVDTLYPDFLVHATSRLDTTAARSFTWAMESEKSHARLYKDAVTAMTKGSGWTNEQLDIYVLHAMRIHGEDAGS